jgi:hypothetical protein
MELDLSKYTLEEIAIIKDKCDSYIRNHMDEFIYICKVRSYGRNWNEFICNIHSLQELCYNYYGEDGIVDVYSNNPNISTIDNYGDLMYIESQEDYDRWNSFEYLKKSIIDIEKELDKWDNRDSVPFRERPYFEPIYSREDLEEMKNELAEFDMSFVAPKRVKVVPVDED